jgi:hypothetical protein
MTIYAYYKWKVALIISLHASFNNTPDRKGIWERAEEVNSMKAYITNDETSC